MAETQIENSADLGEGEKGLAGLWQQEIKDAEEFMDKFKKSAVTINRRYLDKRDANEENEFRVNLYWSTIQVVMSMLYAQPPKADVKRLYDDANDEPSRVGAEMLSRILNNDIQADGSTSNAAIRYAVFDWTTIGMGQVWSRYDVETETQTYDAVTDPVTGMELAPAGEFERITHEDALTEYVHWDDFLYSPARIWEEVRWVARRVYMTREQLVKRFGEEIGNRVPMQAKGGKNVDQKGQQVKMPKDPWNRAQVWEIWDKTTKKVYWYAKGMDTILDQREDPLQLEDFFPCPPVLAANTTPLEMVPRSDYIMAQDQFNQLDEINTRITYLTRAMKAVGVYDRSAEGVQRMLNQGVENQLIPVENWALFSEGGGIKSKVDWMPIEQVANVIDKLVVLREGVKGQIYEVLGISDIMRGNSKASETLGAQQIKAQFGSTRIQLKQFYVAMFVQKALSIKAEIIERHFQPETIIKRSNIQMTPDAQLVNPAMELIKNPEEAKYRVTVQADTLAYVDRKAENDARTAALTALGQFMQQSSALASATPAAAPMLLEMAKWYMAGFKGFQGIEGVFDQAIDAAKQALSAPKQPDPMQEAQLAEKKAVIDEKQAGALDRRAAAVQKLADAELKSQQAMMPFPAPADQFVNGMPQGGGGGAPMPTGAGGGGRPQMPMPQSGGLPPNVMPPNGLPSMPQGVPLSNQPSAPPMDPMQPNPQLPPILPPHGVNQ